MKYFSCDDLAKLSVEDLKKHYIEIRSNINKNKRLKVVSKQLEVYFCYIIREIENRA